MKIAVLAGGVGGAKFLLGVKAYLGGPPFGAAPDDASPAHRDRQHRRRHPAAQPADLPGSRFLHVHAVRRGRPGTRLGRAGETWTASAELAAYGAEAPWFSLGDKDIATHLVRTRMLDAGYPLSTSPRRCASAGRPGSSCCR